MNTLILYDSLFGNTECLARIIADTLRPFGQARAIRLDQEHPVSLEGVDLLILGCPTQGFRPTPAMQTFCDYLSTQRTSGLSVVCFDTRFRGLLWKHSAAACLDSQLRAMGIKPLVFPESFFVTFMKKEGPLLSGEVERASCWALLIQQQYTALGKHLVAPELG